MSAALGFRSRAVYRQGRGSEANSQYNVYRGAPIAYRQAGLSAITIFWPL
jgi:hypothetical protein